MNEEFTKEDSAVVSKRELVSLRNAQVLECTNELRWNVKREPTYHLLTNGDWTSDGYKEIQTLQQRWIDKITGEEVWKDVPTV